MVEVFAFIDIVDRVQALTMAAVTGTNVRISVFSSFLAPNLLQIFSIAESFLLLLYFLELEIQYQHAIIKI